MNNKKIMNVNEGTIYMNKGWKMMNKKTDGRNYKNDKTPQNLWKQWQHKKDKNE